MNKLMFRLFGPTTSRRQVVLWTMVGVLLHQLTKEVPDFWSALDWLYISTVVLSVHWLGLRLQGYRG